MLLAGASLALAAVHPPESAYGFIACKLQATDPTKVDAVGNLPATGPSVEFAALFSVDSGADAPVIDYYDPSHIFPVEKKLTFSWKNGIASVRLEAGDGRGAITLLAKDPEPGKTGGDAVVANGEGLEKTSNGTRLIVGKCALARSGATRTGYDTYISSIRGPK